MSEMVRLLALNSILTSGRHNTKPQLFAAATTIGGFSAIGIRLEFAW